MWTKHNLLDLIHSKLGDYKFILVSNREPYVHRRAPGATRGRTGRFRVAVAVNVPCFRSYDAGGSYAHRPAVTLVQHVFGNTRTRVALRAAEKHGGGTT